MALSMKVGSVKLSLALATAFLLANCAKDQSLIADVGLRSVRLVAQENANKKQVIRVHFVFPKNSDLLAELRKMDATTYFEQVGQLLNDYPNDLEIVEAEVVPGMSVDKEIELKDFRSKAVLVFFDYDKSLRGRHREELRKLCRSAQINLGRNDVTISY